MADKNLSKNIKILTSLVIVLLILQIGFAVFAIVGLSNIYEDVKLAKEELNSTKQELNEKIDTNNAELQNKINELTENLIKTELDLEMEISSLKAETSDDFSGIIETAINSVVSVKTNLAQGTGFLITEDGYIVTNAHVLTGARYANAITSNQETKSMSLIGFDTTLDLALLKISGDYSFLELGDSDDIKIGEKVIAIGNPLGLSFSVTEGIISAVDRQGDNGLEAYIQTDAALNPGNSGGPLINTNSKVIGINNFKVSGENLGFALESNYIKEGINDIALENINQTIL